MSYHGRRVESADKAKADAKNFNEFDNWIHIMEVDPPVSTREKQAMLERLEDILDDIFESMNSNKKRDDITIYGSSFSNRTVDKRMSAR